MSADGVDWLLINASPDLRQQILASPDLHPRHGLRHSPIAAVLVTNGDIDHVAGLLTLRERQAFPLYGTAWVHGALRDNPVFAVLGNDMVPRRAIAADRRFSPVAGLDVTLFTVPGKVPLWQEGDVPDLEADTTVGVEVRCGARRLVYVPGCAAVTAPLSVRIAGADVLLFDGTLYTDDEMIRQGVGAKTGRRMGHMPIAGPGGSLEALAEVPVGRRIYVHINNTNPVLVAGSPERRHVEAAGWTVAEDGLRIDP